MEAIIKKLESALAAQLDWLKKELRSIRSGRPTVELVEDIKAKYFEEDLPIKQLGSLSISPPRDILIQVWDKNAAGPVMKAIESSNVGLSVSNDGNLIRASLSPLGTERRHELVKLVKRVVEEGKIKVRSVRDDAMKELKTAHEKKELTEDALFTGKEKVQKAVDAANNEAERLLEAKAKELEE